MGLAKELFECFRGQGKFSLKDAYLKYPDKPKESIRARIYENLGIRFERAAAGVYCTCSGKEGCLVLEGDGRDLSFLKDESIDWILTDHPWEDEKSNKGGNRAFSKYPCFRYTEGDFREKARVLKKGCFLAEILPEENGSNYQYLSGIKQMAEKCGFLYYTKVPWEKSGFVSNTGRKSKNTQDIMIFSKGKARALRPDRKKGDGAVMSGAKGMLPAKFQIPPVPKKERLHQSELPVSLCEQILEFVTCEGEVVLDTFAGSGSTGEACLNKGRNCILIELLKENVEKIQLRLKRKVQEEERHRKAGSTGRTI